LLESCNILLQYLTVTFPLHAKVFFAESDKKLEKKKAQLTFWQQCTKKMSEMSVLLKKIEGKSWVLKRQNKSVGVAL
jgi:hypothetical protein